MCPLSFSLADTNVNGIIYNEPALGVIDGSHERHLLVAPSWALCAKGAL